MSARRVFVTGASGAIGHHVVETLVGRGHAVVALVRDPDRLQLRDEVRQSVRLVIGDLGAPEDFADDLDAADAAVLLATAWGGPEAAEVNVTANLAIAGRLAAHAGRHLLYVSTASVLGRDGSLSPAAAEFGSDYIRSKHRLVTEMEAFADRLNVVGLFPTVVLGGENGRPPTGFTRILRQAARWARLAGLFSAEGRFHLIHAEDVAAIVARLVDEPPARGPHRLVLGLPAIGADEFVRGICAYRGVSAPGWVRLTPRRAEAFIRLFRVELSEWDRFCMTHPDQSFDAALDPRHFGLAAACPDLVAMLARCDVPTRRHHMRSRRPAQISQSR